MLKQRMYSLAQLQNHTPASMLILWLTTINHITAEVKFVLKHEPEPRPEPEACT